MIDINELRRLAQAATPGPWFSDARGNIWRRPLSDLYENGGSVAGDKPIAFVAAGWRGEGVTGYPVENNARLIAASNPSAVIELLDRLEAAEKERDALRAKIEAMEKQEPAGYGVRYVEPANGEEDWDSIWMHRVFAEDHIKDFTQAYVDIGEPVGAITVVPLYALPGAQPAPSVPEGFSREDLEAVAAGLDGYEKTVNVGNVTGGGDDHLESTTAYAARFIRAMLAAPETKP